MPVNVTPFAVTAPVTVKLPVIDVNPSLLTKKVVVSAAFFIEKDADWLLEELSLSENFVFEKAKVDPTTKELPVDIVEPSSVIVEFANVFEFENLEILLDVPEPKTPPAFVIEEEETSSSVGNKLIP